MALDIAAAITAGQLGAQGQFLTNTIAQLQAAIAANATFTNMSANLNVGGTPVSLATATPLSVSDSATILNALLTVFQGDLSAVNTQLSGM